jgi:hypothetical protein
MLDSYKKLQQHKDFKDWKKQHKDWFLSYIFSDGSAIQLGYADKEGEKVTSFSMQGKKLVIAEDQEVFKKPETRLKQLQLSKVKVSAERATEAAKRFQRKRYSQHPITKTITILQNIDKGQLYNITFVTSTFHTLNIKVDAATARVKQHTLTSLFDFAKKE